MDRMWLDVRLEQKTPDSPGQPADQSGSPNPSHKGEKLNLNPPGAAAQLAARAENGILDEDRPNRFQQMLYRLLALDPSVEQGLIDSCRVIL